MINGTLMTEADVDMSLPTTPIETLTSICLLTGLFQLAFGFFRLGAVSLILSDQVLNHHL